jgi:D-xylulose reductase
VPVHAQSENIAKIVTRDTDGWGANVVFEATGNAAAAATVFEPLCPGGCVVMIGGQPDPILYDTGAAMVREARIENIFRYAHAFPRCVEMLATGAIDLTPLITRKFGFSESISAFEIAASAPPADVKMQIELPQ